MIRAAYAISSLLFGAIILSSCGNKGELFLPSDPQITQQLKELVDSDTPSAEKKTDTDDEPASSNKSNPKPQN
jgi:predicted small lipoprotein YifL